MRKAIVSLGAGPQARLLRLARKTIGPYARRHGYDLHLHTEVLAPERPVPWSKLLALQRLEDRYDLLLWLDADLMIVDGRKDLASELDGDHFLYLVEHETHEGRLPNSGVMLIKTGEQARAFLAEAWAQEDLLNHTWWENAAIARMLGYQLNPPRAGPPTPWRVATKLLGSEWNSIHDDRSPNPLIRHYPGYKLVTRAAFMTRDLMEASARRAVGRG